MYYCLSDFGMETDSKNRQKVLETILVPLHQVEAVAQELTDGNLHSTLEYRSEDEIGNWHIVCVNPSAFWEAM